MELESRALEELSQPTSSLLLLVSLVAHDGIGTETVTATPPTRFRKVLLFVLIKVVCLLVVHITTVRLVHSLLSLLVVLFTLSQNLLHHGLG